MRILVVDDSSAMRAFLRATLEDDPDVRVTEAANGFDALRLLPRERFDLVITDIHMPDINGLELVAFIRGSEAHKTTPLLVISTESSQRDVERALGLGATSYLAKPFEAQQLRDAIARTWRAVHG